jgi:hypothetical protein
VHFLAGLAAVFQPHPAPTLVIGRRAPKNQQFLVCEGKLRSSYGTTACTGVEYALSCPAELDRATLDPQIIGDYLHSLTISLIHMASER